MSTTRTPTPDGDAPDLASVELSPAVLPIGQLLVRAAQRHPDREALVLPGRRWSYATLTARSWSLGRSLIGLGVRPGEHVGILMTNHEDLVASLFAIWTVGAVAVPVNARYRTAELGHLVRDADLVAVVTTDCGDRTDFHDLLRRSLPGLAGAADASALRLHGYPTLRACVSLAEGAQPGFVTAAAFTGLAGGVPHAEVAQRCAQVALRDLALVLYTSGTTSAPRGALLSHEAFARIWLSTGRVFGMTGDDRFWNPLPMFHVAAIGPLVATVGHGATFVSDYWFDAGRGLRQMQDERATLIYPTYPPIISALLAHPDFPATDLSSVTAFLAVAPPDTLRQFQRLAPHATLLTTYGGTEMGPASLSRRTDSFEERIGHCGKPQAGVQLRVVDDDGVVVEPGHPGELQVRGFNMFDGYWGQDAAQVFDADGWFRTGDSGSIDREGNVMFLGRAKDMLKVGGENVAPAEIEAHLARHPAVKLAQVVGIPDDRLGEVAAAFVELVPGAEVGTEELITHCRQGIASFKVPRVLRLVDEWPMSATKIVRGALREQLLAELAAGAG